MPLLTRWIEPPRAAWRWLFALLKRHKKLAGGTVILPLGLWLLKGGAQNAALKGLGWFFTDGLTWLASRPLWLGGLALLGWIMLWIAVAFVMTMPRRRALEAEVVQRQLSEAQGEVTRLQRDLATRGQELSKCRADLAEHLNAMSYGSTALPGLAPLSSVEHGYLCDQMAELQSLVLEAGDSANKLLNRLLHDMAATGENDARYWLALAIGDHSKQTARVFDRLDAAITSRADSREALASFCVHYWKTVEWIGRITGDFLGKPLTSVEGYDSWSVRDRQFDRALRAELKDVPQLEAVRHWHLRQNRPAPKAAP